MSDFSVDISYNNDFGSQGSGNGQFSYPSGLCVLNNEIFVVDKQNNRIQVFDLIGNYQRQFGTVGSGNNNFFFPEDVTTDGTDLYITDSANHRIKKHQIDGTYLSEFGTSGTGNTNFKYPVGIDYNDGKLYISDKQNHRVKTHLINGTYVSQFGAYGTGDNNFNFPEGLAIVNNDLIIADSGNKKIKTFNISGVFLIKITDTIFGYPTGVFNVNNEIFGVVDKTRNRIFFYDNTSSFIKEYGSYGIGNDNFYFPLHAKFDNDILYVVDSGNFRVKILDVTTETEVPIFKDRILKLSKQLYPTGRAFWLNYNNIFSKVHEALAYSESRALQANVGILDSILPDNDNFNEEDAFNWESALGLYIQPGISLSDRKAAILRKMQHPGTIKARQHYLYLQGQLQSAGFNVYVHENRTDIGGGNYEIVDIIDATYDNFLYDETTYGNVGVTEFTKIANYVDESKDDLFVFGDDINLRSTFFIGGVNFGDRANVLESRKDEFRQLILTIKPAQTSGFLLIDYI